MKLLAVVLASLFLVTGAPSPSASTAAAGGHGSASPASTRPAAQVHPRAVPSLAWGLAQIIYGPNDDTTHPFGEGAGMVAYDPGRNITLFGGEGSGGLTNATMNYNATTGAFTWTFLDPSPTPRTNFSFATAPSNRFAVLFGGLTNLASQSAGNDTWVYWFGNQSWKNVSGRVAPPARESAAFAVNDSAHTALLEGGYTPRTTVHGGSGSVLWNDTWELNLTTFKWTRLSPSSAPAPMLGSGLVWDSVADRYDLFGGCGLTCSSALWGFAGAPANWVPIATTGTAPSARAASTFAWDDRDRLALLFGGFEHAATGISALDDTFAFDPSAGSWTKIDLPGQPIAKFDAPSAYANYPGCVGLNIVGGSPTLSGPPPNASLLEPFPSPPTNCFPDLLTGVGGPPPPPCSVANTTLTVKVVDSATGAGIFDAQVHLSGGCIDRTVITDPKGYVNLSVPSPDTLNVSTSAAAYHPANTAAVILPNQTNLLKIGLLPYPTLRLRTWGLDFGGTRSALGNVTVYANTTIEIGVSSPGGYLNQSLVTEPEGNLTVRGVALNHSVGTDTVQVPFTGTVWANLTLENAGPLTVAIVDGRTGAPIPNATGTVDSFDPANPFPIAFRTDRNGIFGDPTLAAGNYSVAASAPGYLPNRTIEFFHPWRTSTSIRLPLELRYGTDLHVLLVDANTSAPIPGGTVFLLNETLLTTSNGWANFTDLLPPGLVLLTSSAPGYEGNFTYVRLGYSTVYARFVVPLDRLSPCANKACPPPGASGNLPSPFGFLPAAGTPAALFLLAAPALLLGALLLFTALRSREPPAPRPGAPS